MPFSCHSEGVERLKSLFPPPHNASERIYSNNTAKNTTAAVNIKSSGCIPPKTLYNGQYCCIFIATNKKYLNMSLIRVLLAIFFPPLAVIDRGCGSVLIVFLLTLCGWVPGVIGALVILNKQ